MLSLNGKTIHVPLLRRHRHGIHKPCADFPAQRTYCRTVDTPLLIMLPRHRAMDKRRQSRPQIDNVDIASFPRGACRFHFPSPAPALRELAGMGAQSLFRRPPAGSRLVEGCPERSGIPIQWPTIERISMSFVPTSERFRRGCVPLFPGGLPFRDPLSRMRASHSNRGDSIFLSMRPSRADQSVGPTAVAALMVRLENWKELCTSTNDRHEPVRSQPPMGG
jgi:hypothetical protein